MNRRTDYYPLLKRTENLGEGRQGGWIAWRPAGFNIACDQDQECGALGAKCPIESEVAHTWEPKILQYGLNLYEPQGANPNNPGLLPAVDENVEALLSFMPAEEVKGIISNPPAIVPSPVVNQLKAVECNFPIAGWYGGVGDTTPRQSYGTNNGKGYLFPRQNVGPQEACAQDKGYTFLILTWRYPAALLDPDKPGCLVIDWEWVKREL
jgi:hypothetical protein